MTKLSINDVVKLEGSRFRHMVGHAPDGGRRVFQGPVDPNPFCFLFGLASVIARDPSARTDFSRDITVTAGQVVEVEGYGQHTVVNVRNAGGEWLDLVKVA